MGGVLIFVLTLAVFTDIASSENATTSVTSSEKTPLDTTVVEHATAISIENLDLNYTSRTGDNVTKDGLTPHPSITEVMMSEMSSDVSNTPETSTRPMTALETTTKIPSANSTTQNTTTPDQTLQYFGNVSTPPYFNSTDPGFLYTWNETNITSGMNTTESMVIQEMTTALPEPTTYIRPEQDISEMPQDIPKFASIINLAGNMLEVFNLTGDFPYLETINLYRNRLREFPFLDAGFVAPLKKLNLGRNRIKEIDYLNPNLRLTILYMGYNRLREIPDLSTMNTSLWRLDLIGNNITSFHPERLAVLRRLRDLYLKYNKIPLLNEDSQRRGTAINVNCRNMHLLEFPHLPNLWYNLRRLYLDSSTINIDYIDRYPRLVYIGLNGCNIGGVFPDFSNISSTLSRITLQSSGITYVDPERLAMLSKLQYINLNNNPLSVIPDVQLIGNNIFTLYIEKNSINSFPKLFESGINIKTIQMSKNNFTIDYIGHLPILEGLYMANCTYGGYFPNLYNVSQTLRYLDLSKNSIFYIEPSYLNDLVQLEVLYLHNNPLPVFPDVPGPSGTLKKLTLHDATLLEFPNLTNLGRVLEKLEVGGHRQKFTEISQSSLEHMPYLEYLEINKTALTRLPDFSRVSTPTAVRLNMYDVAVDCDSNAVLLNLMVEHEKIFFEEELHYPTCATPNAVSGQKIHSIEPRAMVLSAVNKDNFVSGLSSRIQDLDSFHAYLGVEDSLPDIRRPFCVLECVKRGNCLMYALDDGKCTLSNAAAGPADVFLNFTEWYMLN